MGHGGLLQEGTQRKGSSVCTPTSAENLGGLELEAEEQGKGNNKNMWGQVVTLTQLSQWLCCTGHGVGSESQGGLRRHLEEGGLVTKVWSVVTQWSTG